MQRHRILIVDDNPTNVAILEEILEDDYILETALSGEEALEIAPVFRPALILLDIMMPSIDGYETCAQIRETPELSFTKVIMVSARASLQERLQGYEAGADDYVTKPFDEDELLAKVRVYLRLKSVDEMDQLKSNVLSLLSHEVSTPLHSLLMSTDLLLMDEDMEVEGRRMCLNKVRAGADRLHKFFQRILKLSAMQAGNCDLQLTSSDLGEVVQVAITEVAKQAGEHEIHIAPDLEADSTTLLDTKQIKEVVTAMLDNAIRFSPPQGQVIVGVRRQGEALCLQVTDNGKGVDPDFLPYVFGEFADADVAHHTEGHGLSLAIARQIVLAHSGTIDVESTQGEGTTFTVQLPLAA
jgi:two-component system sensor histidine kinase/response regulator